MRKRILKWLFGIDDVKTYIELLSDSMEHDKKCLELIDDHLLTLDKCKDELQIIRKLIVICKNHKIDIDEEIKHIEL